MVWMNRMYDKCTSIHAMLKQSYKIIIAALLLPTLILLSTLCLITIRYHRLVQNIGEASGICDAMENGLSDEIWEIVSGEKQFDEANQYRMLRDARTRIAEIKASPGTMLGYLNAADQAILTLERYVDRLGEQLSSQVSVSYNEKTYQEIVGISSMATKALNFYMFEEIQQMSMFNQNLLRGLLVLCVGIMLLMGLVALVARSSFQGLRQSIRKPIMRLEHMAVAITEGDLDVRVTMPKTEELYALTYRLNLMASNLQNLIDERMRVLEDLQKAEQRALQEQITPHFVYNTFETVIWLAEQKRNEEVVDLMVSITDFFRTTLNGGRDYITVADEEKHVRSYLTIQSARYGSMMQYEVDIDPLLQHYFMLKLMLQPLVENAIYHGIKPARRRGKIVVKGVSNPDHTMTFTVCDNGVGIEPQRLEQITNSLRQNTLPPDSSFGLFNVHKRLCLFYGGCGLTIRSEYGNGTAVCFTIPCKEGGNE